VFTMKKSRPMTDADREARQLAFLKLAEAALLRELRHVEREMARRLEQRDRGERGAA
jgi:hypothetical protein